MRSAARHLIEKVCATDDIFQRCGAKVGENPAHVFGNKGHEPDDMVRQAGEMFAQVFVLRADADGTCIRMTLPDHQATHRNKRNRANAEFFSAEHCGDDDIAAGADAAVGAKRHLLA